MDIDEETSSDYDPIAIAKEEKRVDEYRRQLYDALDNLGGHADVIYTTLRTVLNREDLISLRNELNEHDI